MRLNAAAVTQARKKPVVCVKGAAHGQKRAYFCTSRRMPLLPISLR